MDLNTGLLRARLQESADMLILLQEWFPQPETTTFWWATNIFLSLKLSNIFYSDRRQQESQAEVS